MIKHFASVIVTCVALGMSAFACTANVDDPVIDQGGQNTDADCTTDCTDKQTTCVGKCTEDGCKATCKTDYDKCVTSCS